MNKTARIIFAVVVLLILIAGAYFIFGKKSSNPLKSVQNSVQNKVAQMTTQKKSLADFFSMAGSQKCTFSNKSNTGSGTVYVGGGKMRGDFQSADAGKTTQTHMVNDGAFIYIWTDGEKSGYKMSLAVVKKQAAQVTLAPANTAPSEEQSPSSGPVNMNQQSTYSCGPWSVDSSLFVLPQGITFTDYSSMMQGAGTAMQKVTVPPQQGMTNQQQQSECTQCNQVPVGAMRTQCLTALKCP